MVKNLGNELFKIYCRLWTTQKEKEFDFSKAMEILNIKKDDKGVNLRALSVSFSKIKKAGWMDARLNPENSRTRLYKLKNPIRIVEETGKLN